MNNLHRQCITIQFNRFKFVIYGCVKIGHIKLYTALNTYPDINSSVMKNIILLIIKLTG